MESVLGQLKARKFGLCTAVRSIISIEERGEGEKKAEGVDQDLKA